MNGNTVKGKLLGHKTKEKEGLLGMLRLISAELPSLTLIRNDLIGDIQTNQTIYQTIDDANKNVFLLPNLKFFFCGSTQTQDGAADCLRRSQAGRICGLLVLSWRHKIACYETTRLTENFRAFGDLFWTEF